MSGPVLGIALTVVGSNLSASVAYLAGRYFGRGVLDPADPERLAGKMRVTPSGYAATASRRC